jgi:hypothetical protein
MTTKYKKCEYTNCNGNIIPNRSKHFCSKHQEMYEFFMWMLNHIKVKNKEQTDAGLWLPK